ncbi:DUF411 domain-containing protein [Aetokthonos hydrillicola]|nr:DUF411 domain-containing protein [Aetokthonos hydrillicola CCALA 1050]MBW4585161.1 DUF411 domain-containing protein [Aetokthonos hydrillicola CCALA 1050]
MREYYNRLRPIVVRVALGVVITICLTLGIWVSNAPVSYAQNTPLVYRSPECSCCGGWTSHLKAEGFKVKEIPTSDIEAVKQKYKVPDNLTSCHTAIVNGYVIEGHVPANDIKRLLQEKPNVKGLSVPQMPVGTPGMEIGNQKDPFTVFSFERNGRVAVFNDYPQGSKNLNLPNTEHSHQG